MTKIIENEGKNIESKKNRKINSRDAMKMTDRLKDK